ncbi:hypothetical protein TNCV_4895611 [Trichonephila clavipes]|nr:hypothetical protein TNCV_4895611 [Trichonephila clavipes]
MRRKRVFPNSFAPTKEPERAPESCKYQDSEMFRCKRYESSGDNGKHVKALSQPTRSNRREKRIQCNLRLLNDSRDHLETPIETRSIKGSVAWMKLKII